MHITMASTHKPKSHEAQAARGHAEAERQPDVGSNGAEAPAAAAAEPTEAIEAAGCQSGGTRPGRPSGRATGNGREERTAGPEAGSKGSRTGGCNRRVSPACRR